MNNDIKLEMFKANLKQFQLADLLRIHEGTLSKKLSRKELSTEEKEKILNAIKIYKEENKNAWI